jgi:hypothetical protein
VWDLLHFIFLESTLQISSKCGGDNDDDDNDEQQEEE